MKVLSILTDCVTCALSRMAGGEVSAVRSTLKIDRSLPGELVAHTVIQGEFEGNILVGCSEATAVKLLGAILGESFAKDPKFILDMPAELTNIVLGNFLSVLRQGSKTYWSAPVTIRRDKAAGPVWRMQDLPVTAVEFQAPFGTLSLEIGLWTPMETVQGRQVLLGMRDGEIRSLLSRELGRLGLAVYEADGLYEVMAALREHTVALVLLGQDIGHGFSTDIFNVIHALQISAPIVCVHDEGDYDAAETAERLGCTILDRKDGLHQVVQEVELLLKRNVIL